MSQAIISLKSSAPYSQSQNIRDDRKEGESWTEYEERIAPKRTHVNEDGFVFIPPTALKWCLQSAADRLKMPLGPGYGKRTFPPLFRGGVEIGFAPIVLPIRSEDVEYEWLYLNADGVRHSGKRIWRLMPKIREWEAEVECLVLEPLITKKVLRDHWVAAGRFIGIGRFRAEKSGYYGRFEVEKLKWK